MTTDNTSSTDERQGTERGLAKPPSETSSAVTESASYDELSSAAHAAPGRDFIEVKGNADPNKKIFDSPKWLDAHPEAAALIKKGEALSEELQASREAYQVTYINDPEDDHSLVVNYGAKATALCVIRSNIIKAVDGRVTDQQIKEGKNAVVVLENGKDSLVSKAAICDVELVKGAKALEANESARKSTDVPPGNVKPSPVPVNKTSERGR
jgi:hypothetical protein